MTLIAKSTGPSHGDMTNSNNERGAFSALALFGLSAMIAASGITTSASAQSEQAYELTPDEQADDCKKLTGRMQVRILDLRDYASRSQSSSVSRGVQSAVTGIFGGTDHGKNPDQQYARDLARLEAYNRQLVAKDCKSFDLKSVLQPKPVRDTPSPTVLPPSKAKAGAAKTP